MLSQLLAEVDGLSPRTHVLVVAATNRPDLLDAALLRPGRFDRLVYVPPPDTEARAAILRVIMRSMSVGAGVDAHQVALQAVDFTGADLKALCNAAAYAALDESFEAECVRVEAL